MATVWPWSIGEATTLGSWRQPRRNASGYRLSIAISWVRRTWASSAEARRARTMLCPNSHANAAHGNKPDTGPAVRYDIPINANATSQGARARHFDGGLGG